MFVNASYYHSSEGTVIVTDAKRHAGALLQALEEGVQDKQKKEEMMLGSLKEILEIILQYIVEISTVGLEMAGIIVLVSSAVVCFVKWVKRDRDEIRLDLAQGIALALEFKMGGEVLRTVVVREWSELGILGAIILLRAALTFLIHWEINNEKKEKAGKQHKPADKELRGGRKKDKDHEEDQD